MADRHRIWRRVVWIASALVLAGTGVIGLQNVFEEWSTAATLGQRSVQVAVALYGICGLVAAIGLVARKRWSVPVATAWAVATTYAATMAVIAYGGPDANVIGIVSACLGAALIGALIVWGTRYSLRAVSDAAAVR
ncbi:MAG TPA: hypothetical protein VJ867_04005 [Gemmatimonadaceae bacterium]|nr:hypothetical protein [Gemmatimonadaceae bacterium]